LAALWQERHNLFAAHNLPPPNAERQRREDLVMGDVLALWQGSRPTRSPEQVREGEVLCTLRLILRQSSSEK
jgi:hypothetical protein